MPWKHFFQILLLFNGNEIVESNDKLDICSENGHNVCVGETGIVHLGKCQTPVKVLRRLQNLDLLGCVKECISTSHCTGVNYRTTWRLCDIVVNESPFETSLIEEAGCSSTNIASWDRTIAGECSEYSCPSGESCLYDANRGITCRKTYCTTVPAIDNATVSERFGPHRNVNQIVKYSCTGKTFEMVGNPIAVCRASDQWDVMFHCRKFKSSCPDGWKLAKERCYKIHDAGNSWTYADRFCKREKSLLVELENLEELDAVTKLIQDTTGAKTDYYIGSKKNGKTTVFKWTSSSRKVDSKLFAVNEPNGSTEEILCLRMQKRKQYKLDDYFCNMRTGFICEMEPQ